MRQALSRRLRTCYLLLLIPALLGYTGALAGGLQLPDAGVPTRIDAGVDLNLDGGLPDPGAPARLKFVEMPAPLVAGECQAMTVELQDSSGQPSTASTDTWVVLSSSHSTGHFYGRGCTGSTTMLLFGPGSTRQQVWYSDTLATDVSLDASASGGGLASDTYGPVPVQPGALKSLKVEGFPFTIPALEEHPFSVVAYDAFGNQKSDYTGQVEVWLDDTSAGAGVLPASPYTFTAQDRGRANFTARFGVTGFHVIYAKDHAAPVTGLQGEIHVLPAEAVRFEFWGVPQSVQAGSTITAHLKALDKSGNIAAGYLGKVQFTSADPKARLPGAVQFTSNDGGMMYVDFSFGTAGTWSLVASDVARPQLQGAASTEVLPAAFERIVVTPEPSDLVVACTEVKLALKALDHYDNIVPEAHLVHICTEPATSSVTLVENNLSLAASGSVAGCLEGTLRGTGYVKWRNPQPELVTFVLSDKASWNTALRVNWGPPTFSPAHSTLVFQNKTLDVPQLRSFVGQLGLWFEPRDTCGSLVKLPADKVLSFTGDAPLFFSAPVEQQDGRWTVDVRLPQCPTTGEQPLRIFPTLNQEPVLKPDGTKLKQAVQPVCLPSDVRISLRTEPEGLKQVAPGAVVDFVVEVQNMGQERFLQGLLMVSAKDLTLLEATLDGQPLALRKGGFVLPELAPGATLTIRAKAQASVSAELSAGASVWYANAEGAALTERVDLAFEPSAGLVDVGCGCQAGPLSSQLLPLLAWLAALSHARARSRRVRRGERIDP
ncbi:hypothetical protein [Archangium lansingense]|uniref:DUF11 domain-containing protein n=1 Tax=Archangium lansingense TaxID=2995310 RepID=A0ABT3ZZL9_9BACT|nr:hypothetical protein [Archangium lansinium]MCY1074526.1 hypothetical protein [Archangium lansinium]